MDLNFDEFAALMFEPLEVNVCVQKSERNFQKLFMGGRYYTFNKAHRLLQIHQPSGTEYTLFTCSWICSNRLLSNNKRCCGSVSTEKYVIGHMVFPNSMLVSFSNPHINYNLNVVNEHSIECIKLVSQM